MPSDQSESLTCIFCGQASTEDAGSAWNRPCPDSDDWLHWTLSMRLDADREQTEVMAQYLRRSSYELQKVADAIDALPPRLKRKVVRSTATLAPEIIRNEAERGRDGLHVHGLLDV